MNSATLSPPWYTPQKKLKEMFAQDDSVTVGPVVHSDDGSPSVTVYCQDECKATALSALLKSPTFGNVTLNVSVEVQADSRSDLDVIRAALAYNRRVKEISVKKDHTGTVHVYVVFWPDVCQFANDDTSDYKGNFNALFEDVARDVFNNVPVQFCTADLRENDGAGV
ncbi:MAG: hypothetical protein J6X53_05385 [Abditibacteriota bacterium]|nr:hypothetical protein [Abditibacteriota bacterium]